MTATLTASHDGVATETGGVFEAVSDAHRAAGYDAGYRRAVNDLLAELALVAAEVGRERPESRDALRTLRRRLENQVDGQSGSDPQAEAYVSGGLGI